MRLIATSGVHHNFAEHRYDKLSIALADGPCGTWLAGRGIPQERIRRLIRNPQTEKPVSIKTLERAFATEIQTAKVEVKVQVARFIMDTILGRKTSQRQADKKRTVARPLAIFFAKTYGWRTHHHQRVPGPIALQDAQRRALAKIARLLRRCEAGETDGSYRGGRPTGRLSKYPILSCKIRLAGSRIA